MDAGDWRTLLQADSRQRIIIKIMETLKRHLPYNSTPEGLQELERIALRFEEKIYASATSQSDYLRMLSVKMMSMENKKDSNNWQDPLAQIHFPGQFMGVHAQVQIPGQVMGLHSQVQIPGQVMGVQAQVQIPGQVMGLHSQVNIPGQVMGLQAQVQIPGQVMGVEAAQGMEAGDWRTYLRADSRQRIVNKIADTLKRHLPFSGAEGLLEIQRIANRFEEKIYTEAKSQSEYLRKISLKMLTMETRQQNHIASSSENPGSVITESELEALLQIDAPEVIDIDYSDQEEIDSDENTTKLLMLFH